MRVGDPLNWTKALNTRDTLPITRYERTKRDVAAATEAIKSRLRGDRDVRRVRDARRDLLSRQTTGRPQSSGVEWQLEIQWILSVFGPFYGCFSGLGCRLI